MSEPKSLQEAIVYFSNPDNCIDYLGASVAGPHGVVLPNLRLGKRDSSIANRRTLAMCASIMPSGEFSVKVGSVCEDSAIGLDKWLTALWLLSNCKNGISSCELARDLNVTQKTAWFMLHRIRLALQDETFGSKLGW